MSAPDRTPSESWFSDGANLYEDSAAYGRLHIATFHHPVFPGANAGNAAHAAECVKSHAALLSQVARLREGLKGLLDALAADKRVSRGDYMNARNQARALLAETEDMP